MSLKYIVTSICCVVALVMSATADASLQLRLTDSGGGTVTITDGVDDAAADGFLSFSGPVGSWTLNVSTGVSKPLVGSTSFPVLNLTTNNMSSDSTRTLTIEITDVGFGPSSDPLGFVMAADSTFNKNSVAFSAYVDTADTPFAQGELIDSISAGTGAFDISGGGSVTTSPSPYSVTAVFVLTPASIGVSQFDATLSAIPEPTTIAVWSALGAIGLLAYRRRQLA